MSTTPTETTKRRPARSDTEKMESILSSISAAGWSLSKFLYKLFQIYDDRKGKQQEHIVRDPKHQQMLVAMLQGTSKPTFSTILDLIYQNSKVIPYRNNDTTMPTATFIPSRLPEDIDHAEPAIIAWAVHLVSHLVQSEGGKMVDVKTGLHLNASSKDDNQRKRKSTAERATWQAVDSFSMENLQNIAQENAPITWHLISSYTNPSIREAPGQVLAVSTASIMSMTFGRSERANYYALCLGIWLFSAKASHTIFRVESRLGQTVAYSSVYSALKGMSMQSLEDLKSRISSGVWILAVGDNVQTYARARDHRLGRESRMIKGYAGTAVELQDFDPEASNLDTLKANQALHGRQHLTTQVILDDIDHTHLDNVAAGDFLETLVNFVPTLAFLRKDLDEWISATLTKKQIPTTRKSKITPLATNSADEIHVQGMKQGVLDFFSIQMGIDKEMLANRCFIKSGDGKTFEQLVNLKKYLSAESGDFESFRWLVPLLELWHTKWTDLSRVARAHWGKDFPNDPSTLAFASKHTGSPAPNDLRKIDFYDGAHIVNLTLDANILNLWEGHFKTINLVSYFEELEKNSALPSFRSLLDIASRLARRHSTTRAYQRALHPLPDDPDPIPLGSPWTPSTESHNAVDDQEMMDGDDEQSENLSEFSACDGPASAETADITLGNSILFIRNAIWWREVSRAVARGDTGRIWEILKIWIFTFAGSGNPRYSNYLLEMYCNFKYEYSPKLRDAILMNWLVNLHGKPGMFIEMDLMQEHFNFWLEEMAQHKGKEFDEPFYRKVISTNVHHFLRLKDEMEAAVSLKERSKQHGEPHLNVELGELMKAFRKAQVNRRRPGRDEGFHGVDDFAAGVEILEKGRVTSFVARTMGYMDIMGIHSDSTVSDDLADEDEVEETGSSFVRNRPPPRIFANGNQLIVEDV
ncbi:hypothetical protein H0H93_008157 [Arthromyces matolae]|nr:hypothetical protein H0H93_008157 [Arthromyces matolae]